MTDGLDLASRFADLPALVAPDLDPRFGKLGILAGWLAATGLTKEKSRANQRSLIVFCEDENEVDLPSTHLPELKISHHLLSMNSIEQSIEFGAQIADQKIDSGTGLLFLASDRTNTRLDLEILIGALTRSDAASVTSRQSITDQAWMENAVHIRDEIFSLRDQIGDPPALLTHTQSRDVAAMVGVILQSAKRATPLVILGDAAHCAALFAIRINHIARDWFIPAVDLISPAGVLVQRHLNRQPILELAMNFGRDYQTPIAMTAPIIDAVIALLTI